MQRIRLNIRVIVQQVIKEVEGFINSVSWLGLLFNLGQAVSSTLGTSRFLTVGRRPLLCFFERGTVRATVGVEAML